MSRAGTLPTRHAEDGDAIEQGQIYIAPPNSHLLIRQGVVHLSRGPRENGHRPAIDPMFRSAARAYGRRVVGIILSGALDDGTLGLKVIKEHGGMALVQNPEEALFDSMPRSAIASVAVDQILNVSDMAAALLTITQAPLEEKAGMSPDLEREDAETVAHSKHSLERGEQPSNPSMLTCPDCGGVLWELQGSNVVRFRCHVGHSYALESLVAEQATVVEQALWSALRALEEKAALARRMAHHSKQHNRPLSAAKFQQQAQEVEENANVVRQVLLHGELSPKLEGENQESYG